MLIGATALFAEEKVVTITGEDALWTSTAGEQSGTKDGVTIAVVEGVLSAATADGHYRAYKGKAFTVSVDEGNITGIEVACTANGDAKYGPGNFTAEVGTYVYEGKVGNWTGSAEKVVLMPAGNQVRMTSIKVTYEVGAPSPEATALELQETGTVGTEYYVGDAFSTEGLAAIATFADETTKDVTEAASWSCAPAEIAEDTKSVTVTATYKGLTASKTYDITVKSIANTPGTAYTVEEAVALIDAGKGLNATVYVKGIVTKVDFFNEKYGSLSYYISSDGSEEARQFECYSGLNIGGEKFTSKEDLPVGTGVVVKGKMKKYNTTYELDLNNEIVSTVAVGIDGITAEGAALEGKLMENGRVVVLKAGKKFSVAGQRLR